MLEPPSEGLVRQLLDLKLCTPRDLRRSRRRVRQLARDLPAFDSVWIDALVHARKLTLFQARTLESDRPERLAVGPCVLTAELGRSRHARTYLARRRGSRERCVLKLVDLPPERHAEAADNVQKLVAVAGGFSHPSLVVPHASVPLPDQVVTVSRFVPGPHLAELLVRRGRFSPFLVLEIGRQLLDGLAALAARGSVHGDIRLANIRLTSGGCAVLVDAGVAPAVAPELTIHAAYAPERYDTTAPELIGNGRRCDERSDLYALGCALWQLLAGRPPFTTGDPLVKLAAHQTRRIDDVRKWAPDTPASLAEAIVALTQRDPAERPASFQEAARQWGRPRRAGRKRLARFAAQFCTGSVIMGPGDDGAARTRWPLVAALLFVCAGAAASLWDQGARTQLLQLVHRAVPANAIGAAGIAVASASTGDASSDNEGPSATERPALSPLPAPDVDGTILLTSAGPYEAASITVAGPLTIRGAFEQPSLIIVTDEPLTLRAETLTLENVHVRSASADGLSGPSSAGTGPRSLVLVHAQNLAIEACRFTSASATGGTAVPAVGWKLSAPRDQTAGFLSVRNTVFTGRGSALFAADAPRAIEAHNILKTGPGALVALAGGVEADERLEVRLEHATLRECGTVLRWQPALDQTEPRGEIAIEATECVFDPSADEAALFEFVTAVRSNEWLDAVSVLGDGCLAPPNLEVAQWIDPVTGSTAPLDASRLRIEGIATGPFTYAGPCTPHPADSVLGSFQAALRDAHAPGIDATTLPGSHDSIPLP